MRKRCKGHDTWHIYIIIITITTSIVAVLSSIDNLPFFGPILFWGASLLLQE